MRRSVGGLMLLVAGALIAVAIGSLWLDRVAFSPSADTDSAFAILGDEDVRLQIANVVSGADAAELGVSPADLRDRIEGYTRIRDMAREIRGVVADAHARLIGRHDAPVMIGTAEQVQLVRSERAALQPPITLPVQRVTSIAIAGLLARWTALVAGGLGVVVAIAGLLLRPERGEASFALASALAAIGLSIVTLGYLVPGFLLPAMSDDVWVAVVPELATLRRTTTLVAGGASVALGAIAFVATSSARQRRARSTPLSVGRFREQQRWSG